MSFIGVVFKLIFLLILNYSIAPRPPPPKKSKMAMASSAEGYKEVAHILATGLTKDSTIKPCNDFYEYACGEYIKNNGNSSRVDDFQMELDAQLRGLLESNQAVDGMPAGVLRILRETYLQCKQLDHVDSEWATEVDQVIKNLGGMPMFRGGSCSGDPTEFAKFLANTHKMNLLYYNKGNEAAHAIFTPLLEMTSRFVPKNTLYIQLQVDHDLMQMDETDRISYFQNTLEHYRNGIGQSTDLSRYVIHIKKIIDFEKTLFQNREPAVLTEITYETFKNGLKKSIDIKVYFETLLPVKKNYLENKPTTKIRTHEPTYFSRDIPKVFQDYQGDQSCVIYNYVIFKLIEGSYIVHEEARANCLQDLASSPLKQALAALYAHAKQKSKLTGLKDMAKKINEALQTMIEDANWISERSTRQFAVNKAMEMSLNMGGSNLFHHKKLLADFYGGLPFDSTKSYYENRREISKWFMDRMMERIDKSDPMCVTDYWYKNYALDFNAHYETESNQMIVNLGMSQPPFYKENYPMFYKYGMLGMTVGHEMTHGFDADGRNFDEFGSWKAWSDKTTNQQYSDRALCLVDQYDRAYKQDFNMAINADHISLNEDIADNGGVRAAFKGYKLWLDQVNKNVPERSLHGRTPEQLFFISAAQFFCKSEPESDVREQIEYSDHSPNKYRVNIPFKNFDAFSKAFECANGSDMNPTSKCIIW